MLFLSANEVDGSVVAITGEKYHHLARVRRLRVGERLRAALPDGRVLRLEVAEITPTRLRAHVRGEEPASGISPCRITLFQAVLKGAKMDLVIQKAAELGVHALTPVRTARSVPRWTPGEAARRVGRWQRVADAAAEQCERSVPMRVESPCALRETVGRLPVTLLLYEGEGQSLAEIAASRPALAEVGLYLGPEGGWEDDEVRLLLDAGALPVRLGARTLRAETAGIVAAALAQYLWGDLR